MSKLCLDHPDVTHADHETECRLCAQKLVSDDAGPGSEGTPPSGQGAGSDEERDSSTFEGVAKNVREVPIDAHAIQRWFEAALSGTPFVVAPKRGWSFELYPFDSVLSAYEVAIPGDFRSGRVTDGNRVRITGRRTPNGDVQFLSGVNITRSETRITVARAVSGGTVQLVTLGAIALVLLLVFRVGPLSDWLGRLAAGLLNSILSFGISLLVLGLLYFWFVEATKFGSALHRILTVVVGLPLKAIWALARYLFTKR